jgi:hypothetical protein
MLKKKIIYSIWGILDAKSNLYLKKIQENINKKFKGPKFKIHLTISSDFKYSKNKLLSIFSTKVKNLKSFYVYSNDLSFENKFFRSIFLKIKLNKKILNYKIFFDNLFKYKKKNYYPHISLYYGSIPTKYKKNFFLNFKIKIKKIKIIKFCLVRNDEINLKWQVIKSYHLQ